MGCGLVFFATADAGWTWSAARSRKVPGGYMRWPLAAGNVRWVDAEHVRRLGLSLPGGRGIRSRRRSSFRVHSRPRFASGLDEGISIALSEDSFVRVA